MTCLVLSRTVWRAALATLFSLAVTAGEAQADVVSLFNVASPQGGSVVRAIVTDAACPAIAIDGATTPMTPRGGPRTYPARPSDSGSAAALPSVFPVRVCETPLPRGVRHVAVGGQAVALLPPLVRRIVLIGDTGCRLKRANQAWQACSDAAVWPFARIARAAAAAHPDLVLHVGDYHYRENACPEGNAGCAGSPWAYGWDAWNADFFTPAAPLLAAAPWVMVRGNHENCMRAGQGWWLLLDPHALSTEGDCSDPAKDWQGDHGDPYAVDLGGHARLIVADFAAIGDHALTGQDLERYRHDAEQIEALAPMGETNFVAVHQPFGVVEGTGPVRIGLAPVASAFAAADGVPAMPTVTAMLAGHVHMLQFVDQPGHPVQIVTGFSGTLEDAPAAPASLSALMEIPEAPVLRDLVTRLNRYGFGLLERQDDGNWLFTAHGVDGEILLRRVVRQRARR